MDIVCTASFCSFVPTRISQSRKVPHRNFTAETERSSRCTAHRNSTSPGQPPAISRCFFLFQLRQKLVTCSLSNGDPITALKSLPVTMLIRSYLHMRPQKSKANCPIPHPLLLARLPKIVHSAGGLVRHFQTVKSCSGKLFGTTVKMSPLKTN